MLTINQRTKRIISLKNSRAFVINDLLDNAGNIVKRRLTVSLVNAVKYGIVEWLLINGFYYSARLKQYRLVLEREEV